MKIKIEKCSDHYRADCSDLPGSPPVGLGETAELAMAHLMWLLLFSSTNGPNDTLWYNFVRQHDVIMVNDLEWKLPESYKR